MNPVELAGGNFLETFNAAVVSESRRLNSGTVTLDIVFLVFLRLMSRFGFFSFGPIVVDVRLLEDLVDATVVRRNIAPDESYVPSIGEDYAHFSQRLMEEVRRSGRSRIDELHFLLAFMKVGE